MNLLMIAAAAAITYSSRSLLMVFGGRPGPRLSRFLQLAPVAIFAALVVPGYAAPDGDLALGNEILAGALGLAVALLTRNVFLTLLSGYLLFVFLGFAF